MDLWLVTVIGELGRNLKTNRLAGFMTKLLTLFYYPLSFSEHMEPERGLMTSEIQAKDIMRTEVICVSVDSTLAEARDLLVRQRISGAPVIDEDGMLIGVLSLSDIVRVGLARDTDDFPENAYFLGIPNIYGAELGSIADQLEERAVEEAMSTEVYTAAPDDRLSVLAVTMRHHRIHRLIITEGKKVVGIVTAFDLIQVLENH